eukprot:6337999-Amphidinium_carterae.1
MVATVETDKEMALVDSGSGLVACPLDYCTDVPLQPPLALPPMSSASGSPIENHGRRTVSYYLEDGSRLAITWTVSNVNCLILATAGLTEQGLEITLANGAGVLRRQSGASVPLHEREFTG